MFLAASQYLGKPLEINALLWALFTVFELYCPSIITCSWHSQGRNVPLQTCCFDDIINDFHGYLLITYESDRPPFIEKFIKFLGPLNHFLFRIPGVGEWDMFNIFLWVLPVISICKYKQEKQEIQWPLLVMKGSRLRHPQICLFDIRTTLSWIFKKQQTQENFWKPE